MLLFHIAEKNRWQKSLGAGWYDNLSLKKDGFIHCCGFNQLLHVGNAILKNINADLVVLCIDADVLQSEVKWETDENNKTVFPHVYGPINISSVIDVMDFRKNQQGEYFISDELMNFSHYEKSCGAIVFHKFSDEYRVLLIGFPYDGGLRWGYPKGHVENDETEVQTAAREIKEEVGLDVKINSKFRETTHFSLEPGHIKEVVYFCAETSNTKTTPQEGEVEKTQWFNFEDAYNYLTYDCDKNILLKFKERFNDLC